MIWYCYLKKNPEEHKNTESVGFGIELVRSTRLELVWG